MFHIYDIQKKPEGLSFAENLQLTDQLRARNPEILDVSAIQAAGSLRFEAGLYFLDYQLTYQITLASSRSLAPVVLEESYPVQELFIEAAQVAHQKDLVEEELVLVLEGETIDLAESVADNILLSIPSKVLTPEEESQEALPSGQDWAVLTEEAYEKLQQEKKEENSPFAQLQGLFEEE